MQHNYGLPTICNHGNLCTCLQSVIGGHLTSGRMCVCGGGARFHFSLADLQVYFSTAVILPHHEVHVRTKRERER